MKTSRDDGKKQFSIQHPTYFSHHTCIMPSSLLVFILFAVLLSLHLHIFLMFSRGNRTPGSSRCNRLQLAGSAS